MNIPRAKNLSTYVFVLLLNINLLTTLAFNKIIFRIY